LAIRTNEFFGEAFQKQFKKSHQLRDIVRDHLIDLYLSVKIRTNDEIDLYDENRLEIEREKLRTTNKVDELTLIDYIKLSIEIMMNMKYEDFEREYK
jgi:hypothetical protein